MSTVASPAVGPTAGPPVTALGRPSTARHRRPRRLATLARPGMPSGIAVAAGNAAAILIGLASGIVTARVLGPTARGAFVATQTMSGVAAVVLTLGVTQAVVTGRGSDRDLAGPLLAQVAVVALVAAALFGTLAGVGAQPWLDGYGVIGAAAATAGAVAASLASGMAQRRSRMTGEFQLVRLLPSLAGLFLLVVAWRAGTREVGVWLLCSGVGVAVPAVVMLARTLGEPGTPRRPARFLPSRALVRGAVAALPTAIGAQVIYRLDSVVVAAARPTSDVAFYGVAATASLTCTALGQAVGMLAFSRLRHAHGLNQQRLLIRRGVRWALGVAAGVALPVMLLAPELITLCYGREFLPAVAPTRALVLAAIPLSADYLLIHALLSLSGQRSVYGTQALAAALTVVGLCVTVPTGNLALIAAMSIVIYTLSAALMFGAVLRRTAPNRRDTAPNRPASAERS
ncbi:lipopolysaccharide biosynthesis protein [Frankia sp. CiP1_Cm_nod1]